MQVKEKYQKVYMNLPAMIAGRKEKEIYPALGFHTNLDLLCHFNVHQLNELLEAYLPNEKLSDMMYADSIETIEDLLRSLVYYCVRGIGGEVDISNMSFMSDCFQWDKAIGGSGVQAAMALSALGCPSIVHMTDNSKDVCDIMNTSEVYTVSDEGELVHTDKIPHLIGPEIHYIIQFKKGEEICLGTQKAEIPSSNRLIVTQLTINARLPLSQPYLTYIEEHARNISSYVLSSFNGINDKDVALEKVLVLKEHLQKYKEANPDGIVYFEDAYYHDMDVRKCCMDVLYPQSDIVSFNEEELEYTLKSLSHPIDPEDIFSCIRGANDIKEMFAVRKGIIVHTKDYSMYVGENPGCDIETGLICGNMIATGKTFTGKYAVWDVLERVNELPLSEAGLKYREAVEKSEWSDKVVIVPTKYVDKPNFTIGLGDSFLSGVQICF